MTVAPPSVRIEPGIGSWSVQPRPADADRTLLIERINTRAKRLGAACLDPAASHIIATGHQAQLWHPGILAKDIAMDVAVHRAGTRAGLQRMHLIVDQDANEAWRLEAPRVERDELKVKAALLATQMPGVSTGFQPPADVQRIKSKLADFDPSSVGVLAEAFEDLPTCESLAEQVAVVLARLKKPYVGDVPVMMVSDLTKLPVFDSIVDRMLNDAQRCGTEYNKAVSAYPQAGMTPMAVGRELVELPLWAVAWERPRRRVFVDLADTTPMFVFEDGEPIDLAEMTLLPRALLLTAVMRGYLCDLFIHGTGGLVYDRVTEAWWRAWAGETLAPMAGVTANIYLDLDAPIADAADLQRAVWRRHHLPHNLDRALNLSGPAVQRKRELLAHMNDDRDKTRRRSAFRELHQINRALADQHSTELEDAERALRLAQVGAANSAVAGRRDWCFALYPPKSLHGLRTMIENAQA